MHLHLRSNFTVVLLLLHQVVMVAVLFLCNVSDAVLTASHRVTFEHFMAFWNNRGFFLQYTDEVYSCVTLCLYCHC